MALIEGHRTFPSVRAEKQKSGNQVASIEKPEAMRLLASHCPQLAVWSRSCLFLTLSAAHRLVLIPEFFITFEIL